MINPWPAISVGIFLVGVGLALVRSHRRSWTRQQADGSLSPSERIFFFRRYRRRTQVAWMLSMLGALIGAGDLAMQLMGPFWSTLYWIGVLIETGWVMVLALADMWSTATFSHRELSRVHEQQREIERQLVEFKQARFQATAENEELGS